MMNDLKPATTGFEEEQPRKIEAAVAIPAGQAGDIPMWQQRKEGGKCCGCCCDYRRAVIVLSIISLVLGILGLIGSGSTGEAPSAEDDDLANELGTIADDYKTGETVMAILGVLFSIVSLVGAIRFNAHMVGLAAMYTIFSYLATIIVGMKHIGEVTDLFDERDYSFINGTSAGDAILTEDDEDDIERAIKRWALTGYFIGALFVALWVYPSIFLVKEIRAGTMTQETYPREQHSCCCTPNKQ